MFSTRNYSKINESFSLWLNSNEKITPTFPLFLFNNYLHLKIQPCKNLFRAELINVQSKQCYGILNFFIKDKIAYSPLKAPFGSLEFNNELKLELIENFFEQLLNFLCKKKINKLIIKSYPEIYNLENSAILKYLFIKNNFKITHNELNFHKIVDENKFITNLHPSEKKRLRKSYRKGYHFIPLQLNELENVYSFLKKVNMERHYSNLSMDLKLLQKTVKQFPEHFFLFVVVDGSEIISAAITIKVNSEILYIFYSGFSPDFSKDSPIVFLYEGIYNFCYVNKIKLLDFGTSMLGNKPNYNLIRFKRNLGTTISSKLIYEKIF